MQDNMDIQKLLGDYWVLISFKEEEGLNFHMKNQESISLIAMLLAHRPELWDIVKQTVWDIKKNKKP